MTVRVIFSLGLLFHWSLSVFLCQHNGVLLLWLCSTVRSHEFINLTEDGKDRLLKTLKHGRRAEENTRQKDFLHSKIICVNGPITKGNLQSWYHSHQNSNDILQKIEKILNSYGGKEAKHPKRFWVVRRELGRCGTDKTAWVKSTCYFCKGPRSGSQH